MSKHILVLGATGGSGLAFCKAALRENHTLTLYIRNPSKLPSSISENPKVTVVTGEFTDEVKMTEAVASGASVFVSFAGPVGEKGTPVTDCYKMLYPLLLTHNYTRAMVLSTPSYDVKEDLGGWKWSAAVNLIWLIAGSAYKEVRGIGRVTAEQPVEKLKWTIFRVGFLGSGEGEARPTKATFTGTGEDSIFISRKSMAEWVLAEMTEEKWVGKAPLICN